MKKTTTNPYDVFFKDLSASVTSPQGTSLDKMSSQVQLFEALKPYMTQKAEAEFKQRILEQILGDGTGILKEEKQPEGRSLDEFLETLK